MRGLTWAAALIVALFVLTSTPAWATETPTPEPTTEPTGEPSPSETPSPEPTGSPSPSEPSTPASEPSPTPTESADPLPATCSVDSPCVVELADDPVIRDWMEGLALAAALLVALTSVSVVGSWRR